MNHVLSHCLKDNFLRKKVQHKIPIQSFFMADRISNKVPIRECFKKMNEQTNFDTRKTVSV